MRYFTIKELCASETAVKLGIKNEPTKAVIKELTALVDNVLDPLREAWGAPIHVNSGYRCPALNKAVNGSKTSHHLTGKAVDITAIAPDRETRKRMNRQLFYLCDRLNLPFCQLIDESGYTWLHISFDSAQPGRHEIKHL